MRVKFTKVVLLFSFMVILGCFPDKSLMIKKKENHISIAKKYNIVLISIDSLRRDHLGIYGYDRNTSPNIDQFAKTSWLFKNYYSTDYLTPVSEKSVHTGLFPDRKYSNDMKKKTMTLGHILKGYGYYRMAFGNSPEFQMLKDYNELFTSAFDLFKVRKSRTSHNRQLSWDKISTVVTTNKKAPLFLWFALGSVHAPFGYLLPNKFADPNYRGAFYGIHYFANMQYYYDGYVYDPREKGKQFNLVFLGNQNHLIEKVVTGIFPKKVTSKDFKFVNDIYDNGVSQADYEVGKIIQILKDNNLYDNSLIILQSEHGETIGERKYIAHSDIHDEMVHMPLIIHVPNTLPQILEDKFVSGIDILPTILDILNISFLDYKLDGKSIISRNSKNVVTAKPTSDEVFFVRTPLWETTLAVDKKNSIFDQLRDYQLMIGSDLKEYAIKVKNFKLIHRRARFTEMRYSAWTFISGKKLNIPEYEFFNVLNDPKEMHPILAMGKDFDELKKRLLEFEIKLRNGSTDVIFKKELQDYR
jgi:arylsulfatase A-like enzyme